MDFEHEDLYFLLVFNQAGFCCSYSVIKTLSFNVDPSYCDLHCCFEISTKNLDFASLVAADEYLGLKINFDLVNLQFESHFSLVNFVVEETTMVFN